MAKKKKPAGVSSKKTSAHTPVRILYSLRTNLNR